MPAESRDLSAVAAEPGSPKPDPILVVDGLQRSFGGLKAVDVDHLEIQRGTITSMIGPNGAGKTTLFNLLTGFDRPQEGHWHLNGGALVGIPAFRVARKGMVRTFQLTKSLARLTVLENMLVAARDQVGESFWGSLFGRWKEIEERNRERAMDTLERFGMAHMAGEYAGSLSGGQRKLLEMARALLVEPELVMLDEPTAGVNPALTQSLLGHIQGLRDDGLSVVFIEHDMDVVQEISDWVVCLAEGRVIAEGPPGAVARNPKVIDAYLGGHHGEIDE
ncbi:MAG: ABC transporter ATP-binding protein [Acidimicrobiia bacterium]|nr:ABC transporter ATP-binding protein [Acidimicrobiia bacterium]